jgi:hypothetical protein
MLTEEKDYRLVFVADTQMRLIAPFKLAIKRWLKEEQG